MYMKHAQMFIIYYDTFILLNLSGPRILHIKCFELKKESIKQLFVCSLSIWFSTAGMFWGVGGSGQECVYVYGLHSSEVN